MTYRVNHFINGALVENARDDLQNLYNPATGEIIGQVAIADKTDVDTAVNAAKKQFVNWSQTPPMKRAQFLFRFRELLLQHKNELAEIITREHGKTLLDAQGSLQRGIDVVEYACGIPHLLQSQYAKDIASGIDAYSLRQPLGVCVGITPFNFPAMIPLWMFPIAIMCGNTFILKPSEKDPSVALRIVELAHAAGIPAGVLNVVQGAQATVENLLTHPDVKAISFVGSTAVAAQVYKIATNNGKRAQVFGGAKNHAVVMPDADLEQTADAIIGAAYGSAGERCMAISAVVCVGDKVADQLLEKLIPRVKQLKIGAGTQAVDIGPLVTKAHLDRVLAYINSGVTGGAQLVVDGRDIKHLPQQGFYLGGCLFDKVTPEMQIYKEEIFGPVLVMMRVKDFAQALELTNTHTYGNGTAIFTNDGHFAREFAAQVQAGMVGINIPIPVPAAHFSFGGWKQSVFGDLGMHGPEGVQFYTKLKTIAQRWPREQLGAEFAMPVMK